MLFAAEFCEKSKLAKKASADSGLKYMCFLIPFWLWQEYCTLDSKGPALYVDREAYASLSGTSHLSEICAVVLGGTSWSTWGHMKKTCKCSPFFACYSSKRDLCVLCMEQSLSHKWGGKVRKERDKGKSGEKRHKGFKWSEIMYMLGLYILHIPWTSFPLGLRITPWTPIHRHFITVISTAFS